MEKIEFFDLNICKIASPSEFSSSSFIECDLVEVEAEEPSFGFVRPQKISWRAHLDNLSDPIQVVKSKKLRKSLAKWERQLSSVGLTVSVSQDLTDEEFEEFLVLYRKLVGQKQRANIALSSSWLEKKREQGKNVGAIFVYKGEKLLGGNLVIFGQKWLIVGYGVARKIENLNLGALLDYLTIKYGSEKGYKTVSFGRDTNLYGFHLSTGLFSYKARLGLTPEPNKKAGVVTTKFLSFEKFDERVLFLTTTSEGLEIVVLWRGEEPSAHEFEARGVKVRLVRQDENI